MNDELYCPVEVTAGIIGGKWKPLILFYLQDNTRRFSAIQKLLPGVTKKMLTQRLRELESDGIVHRKGLRASSPSRGILTHAARTELATNFGIDVGMGRQTSRALRRASEGSCCLIKLIYRP